MGRWPEMKWNVSGCSPSPPREGETDSVAVFSIGVRFVYYFEKKCSFKQQMVLQSVGGLWLDYGGAEGNEDAEDCSLLGYAALCRHRWLWCGEILGKSAVAADLAGAVHDDVGGISTLAGASTARF